MSSTGLSTSSRPTPRLKLRLLHNTVRPVQADGRMLLSLQTVIGTTTTCASAFDSESGHHCFVYCVGPAAVVSQVDEDLTITQRLFRAPPNALPMNETPSFYNPSTLTSSPGRGRHGSPLKALNWRSPHAAPLQYAPDSPGTSKIQYRVKEAACVSLSRQCDYLAVGEVGNFAYVN